MVRVLMDKRELIKLISDHMEDGFLENIIDMFKHDSSLYELTGTLLKDERMRVRIGVTALIEELKEDKPYDLQMAVPSLLPLLKDENPAIRGDAAHLIGIIGSNEWSESLAALINDPDPQVVSIVKEILDGQ